MCISCASRLVNQENPTYTPECITSAYRSQVISLNALYPPSMGMRGKNACTTCVWCGQWLGMLIASDLYRKQIRCLGVMGASERGWAAPIISGVFSVGHVMLLH